MDAATADTIVATNIIQAEVADMSMLNLNDHSNSLDPVIHIPERSVSPSIADPPTQDHSLALIGSSDEISNSSIQEDPIGENSHVGDIPDPKRLTSPLMASRRSFVCSYLMVQKI